MSNEYPYSVPQTGTISPDLSDYPSVDTIKKKIEMYIKLRLGDQIIDIELDKEHIDLGIEQALIEYRSKSSNSVEESYCFLDLVKETQDYILPKEIMSVRQLFRRGIGSTTGTTASSFEPFASGFMNAYLLSAAPARVGGLVNFEAFAGYQKLASRMFGGSINFTFNSVTKKLTIARKIPESGEAVLIWCYNYKPDVAILNDHMAYPWIQKYAFAFCKQIVGQARSKFASTPGPNGSVTMNGSELKQEAQAEMDMLIQELKMHVDQSNPIGYGFIIG